MASFQKLLPIPAALNIIVLTMDAGNEIDDEIAAWIVMNKYPEGYMVYFCQVPGASTELDVISHRIQRMQEIFPTEFGTQDIWCPDPENMRSSKFVLCTFSDLLLTLKFHSFDSRSPFIVDWFIQIAPMWGFEPEDFSRFAIGTRVFMGDLENPDNSINGTKAMPKNEYGDFLRNQFKRQQDMLLTLSENTIPIPTSFARQVPTPVKFINRLPPNMSSQLLQTAFNQFVGRVDPTLAWAENISIVNHATILKMLPSSKLYDILTTQSDMRVKILVNKFLEPIAIKPVEYTTRLEQIANAVEYITKVEYDESGSFNAKALKDPNVAFQNWLQYITENDCNLTPFYDGLAIVAMMKGILPPVEECLEIIKTI
tara:strand:- start:1778 stop:2887 length:1110 start_codon:yes stop_codon:yes gene_type:complete